MTLKKPMRASAVGGKSSTVKSGGAFHLSRNSGWDANRKHVFRSFHWKIPGNKGNFERVALFSRRKLSSGNACSRLFTAISLPPF